MNDRSRVDDNSEFFDCDVAARTVNPHAGGTGDPCRHIAFLPERRCDAEADILWHATPPTCLLGGAGEHCRLPMRAAYRVRRRSGVTSGAVEQSQPERHRLDASLVGCLVHKTLDCPTGPTRADRPQITRSECPIRQVIAKRPHAMCANVVAVVGTRDGEWIVRSALSVFTEEIRSDRSCGPTSRRVMIHCCDPVAIAPGQAQDLA